MSIKMTAEQLKFISSLFPDMTILEFLNLINKQEKLISQYLDFIKM